MNFSLITPTEIGYKPRLDDHPLFIYFVIQVTHYPIKSITAPLLFACFTCKKLCLRSFQHPSYPFHPSREVQQWSSWKVPHGSHPNKHDLPPSWWMHTDRSVCPHFHFLLLKELLLDRGKISSSSFSSANSLCLLDSPPCIFFQTILGYGVET